MRTSLPVIYGCIAPVAIRPMKTLYPISWCMTIGIIVPVVVRLDYLGNYSGYLQVDGYQSYEQTQATLAGYWAHTRRKFKEIEVAQGKGKTGKAIGYNWNKWHKLVRYVDDGNLAIDNIRAERPIKPFVIGRKEWLFSYSKNGANASAILYNIIETAKANGLTPFDYIIHCLGHLAVSSDNVEALLPWNVKSYKV